MTETEFIKELLIDYEKKKIRYKERSIKKLKEYHIIQQALLRTYKIKNSQEIFKNVRKELDD